MAELYIVAGDIPLKDIETRLNYVQNTADVQVINVLAAKQQGNNDTTDNVVTALPVDMGVEVKDIRLVQTASLGNPTTITTLAGKTLLFTSDIYVNGNISKVNGYH
jgi:hypothetical protein